MNHSIENHGGMVQYSIDDINHGILGSSDDKSKEDTNTVLMKTLLKQIYVV